MSWSDHGLGLDWITWNRARETLIGRALPAALCKACLISGVATGAGCGPQRWLQCHALLAGRVLACAPTARAAMARRPSSATGAEINSSSLIVVRDLSVIKISEELHGSESFLETLLAVKPLILRIKGSPGKFSLVS